jgi:predicted phage-related endonuclease
MIYEFQVQHQLHLDAVNGREFDLGCIGTLGRRQSSRLYFREYDAELGAMIDEETEKFWKSVRDGIPPPADFSMDGALLEKLAKPTRMGESCNLSLNNRAVELIHSWKTLDETAQPIKKQLHEIEQQKTSIKNEIHAMMADAETAVIGDFIVSAKETVVEEKFVNEYSFRRFDVKKRKGK